MINGNLTDYNEHIARKESALPQEVLYFRNTFEHLP